MRSLIDAKKVFDFVKALSRNVKKETRLYLTGGATAVLKGWRESTIDINFIAVPENDDLMRALPRLKEDLRLSVELSSPAHFIPKVPGWEERSEFVEQEGKLSVYHYDLYSQALAKIERGHEKDLADVTSMVRLKLIAPRQLRAYFRKIEDRIYKYPALDLKRFRAAVDQFLKSLKRT